MLVLHHRSYFIFGSMILAAAVGVNLVVFTVVCALWLRPLPFPAADRLVALPNNAYVRLDHPDDKVLSSFEAVAGQVITDDRFGSQFLQAQIRFDSISRDLETLAVTPEYFRLFGFAIQGRDFTPDDNRAGAEPVAIISHRLWSSEFGRRADLIGAIVSAKPVPIRVIGVAPQGFQGARRGERADVWIPSGLVPRIVPARIEYSLPLMAFARLFPGQTAVEAERRIRETLSTDREKANLKIVPLKDVFGTPESRTIVIREGNALMIVGGLAMLVLLGGCATVAALVLVHFERRRGEVAVKIALGASRRRLMADRAMELGWLAGSGTIAAVLVAFVALRTLPSLSLPGGVHLGRLDLSIDWRVLTAAVIATVLILLVAACVPVIRFTRANRASDLLAGPASTPSAGSQRVRQTLLALQVCATIIVMVAAGLFVRAVIHGFGAGPGFDVDRTAFVTVQMLSPLADPGPAYTKIIAERTARVTEVLRSVPGVDDVAEGVPPIGPEQTRLVASPVIVRVKAEEHSLPLGRLDAGSELLRVLGVSIVAGRALTVGDATTTPVSAVVTASLAERLWPTQNPLGQVVWTSLRDGKFVIVGIARDFVFGSLARPAPGVVITARRRPANQSRFVVRAAQPARLVGPIRQALKVTLPDAPWVHVATGREIIANDLGRQRLGAWFFSGFGLVALVLGLGGVFGLVAYLAESRQREFGVRLALGATPQDLLRHGVSAALLPVSIGVAIGLVVAAWISHLFTSLLTGLSPVDPLTYGAVATVMLGAAASAGLVAAWRLNRVLPADALRTN